MHKPAALASPENSLELQSPRLTESESAFLARFQAIHMYSKDCKHALGSYVEPTVLQPSMFRSWILTHLSTYFESDIPEQPCSTWHWWMDTSILLSTTGSPWIIPLPKLACIFSSPGCTWLYSQRLPRSTTSAPSCPLILPGPRPLNSCQVLHADVWGRRDWNFLFRTDLDRFKHWWAQFREEVESAERFREQGGQFPDVSFPEQPEVSIWALFKPPLPNCKLTRKLPLNPFCETH